MSNRELWIKLQNKKNALIIQLELLNPIVAYVYHQTYFNEIILEQNIKSSTKNLINYIYQEFPEDIKKIENEINYETY